MKIQDIQGVQPPKSLKPQEIGTYNPAWVDLSIESFKPVPNDAHFRYLWVITDGGDAARDDGLRLIVGVEFDDVGAARGFYKQYGIDIDRVLSGQKEAVKDVRSPKEKDEALGKLIKLGHPTVSAVFESVKQLEGNDEHANDGAIFYINKQGGQKLDVTSPSTSYGRAYFGGELNFIGGKWSINNHSGRHSGARVMKKGPSPDAPAPLSAGDWEGLMQQAKLIFHSQMKLDVEVRDLKLPS